MAYSQSYWRNIASPIISRVIQENQGKTMKEIRAALRVAYPFGTKKYHPYRVWCDEVRIQLGLRGPLGKGKTSNARLAQLAGIDVRKAFLGPRIPLEQLPKSLDTTGEEEYNKTQA